MGKASSWTSNRQTLLESRTVSALTDSAGLRGKDTIMLYEFKSKAAGTVVMTGAVGDRMLGIIGRAPGPQGVFTPEQLGAAIEALQAAITVEKLALQQPTPDAQDKDDETSDTAGDAISLAQRALPLIELLSAARAAGKPVTWGV
jgi:cyclopropane-fatty-acyl-phospholipid synthase